MKKIKVLLVDDDVSLGSIYTMGLQHLGFEAHYLSSFIAVIETINEFQPNVVVLDVELGDKNGINESETILRLFPGLPIIFISSHTEIEYIKQSIEYGGVIYLKKPFEIEELGVYIKRFASVNSNTIGFGNFKYNFSTFKLENCIAEQTYKLSNREGKTLQILVKNINNITTRSQIEHELWQDKDVSTDLMLNNIISRLRKLISTDSSIQIITIPRVGYKLSVNGC